MFVIYNTQNTANKPRPINGAGSNRKAEAKGKSKGKGARLNDRPITEI